MFGFSLPSLDSVSSSGDNKKIKSYLYQLTEQLRHVLNNIDTENFSEDLAKQYEGTVGVAQAFAKLDEYVNGGLNKAADERGALEDSLRENELSLRDIYHELMAAIAAAADDVTVRYKRELEATDQELRSTMREEYSLKSETASLEAAFLSRFQQTARDMMAIFEETYEGDTDELGLRDFAANFSTYIRFGMEGIEIGKSDNVIVARLANNRLSFIQKGTGGEYEVAYISDKKLFITEAQVTGALTVGSDVTGMFEIKTDPMYGFMISYKGGTA